MKTPIVSIIGKPNVGKSTLFNRLSGSRIAITADEAGTTRDRLFFRIENDEIDFFIVDTGGLEFETKKHMDIEDNMQKQAHMAMEESDLVLFLVNAKEEFTKNDFQAAELLRKMTDKKPIILTASKCDHELTETDLAHMYELGLGEPIAISALHNSGLEKLKSQIIKKLKERHFLTKDEPRFRSELRFNKTHLNIALTGKTNVGKSSIINALLNQEKLIVSDTPHTTRDSIDTVIKHNGKEYNFIDTAGLKRKGKIERGISHFSVLRTLATIEKCDIALLVIDSGKPISHQDQQIANTILKNHKGLIIVANKWDLKNDDEENEKSRRSSYLHELQKKFPFLSWAPVVFTSALAKKNLTKIFDQIEIVAKERKKRIPTATLNNFTKEIVQKHEPTGTKNIRPKIFYITQDSANPPHFTLFVNKKKYFHFTYPRYLENRLREKFGFIGTSLVMEFREKEQRYGKKTS